MKDSIAAARGWLTADLLGAQRTLARAVMPADVPTHVEVLTDILDDQTKTLEWRTTVALAVLAARDA